MISDFIKNLICDRINNVESEEYCNLTDSQVDEIAENIVYEIMEDRELINELNNSIDFYANRYIDKYFKK